MFENLIPLVVDLDGTLIKSDLLLESYFLYIKSKPLSFYKPLIWLIKGGKATLKTFLAQQVSFVIEHLPYDAELMAWLHTEKKTGKKLVLATASHKRYAKKIADHLGLFDQVLATEKKINLSAKNKRDTLIHLFGEKGFDYVGNSKDDLDVWKYAKHAILVRPERGVRKRAYLLGNVKKIIKSDYNLGKSWIEGLRLHQWVKNLLVFVPCLLGHYFHSISALIKVFIAFILFSLCASSVYLLNDLMDLESDRHHHKKRHRPFAAGNISIKSGLFIAIFLLAITFFFSLIFMPVAFLIMLITYYFLTLNYTLWLKQIVVLDVIVLSLLYTLRILAGGFALGLEPTFWILAFSLFIFLSLAFVKRYAELGEVYSKEKTYKAHGRGYYTNDLDIITILGSASGYISVSVLAFYIQDANTALLYRHPKLIWLACPIFLFWISRTWLLAHRGKMQHDPIVFALKDKVSLMLVACLALIFSLAI